MVFYVFLSVYIILPQTHHHDTDNKNIASSQISSLQSHDECQSCSLFDAVQNQISVLTEKFNSFISEIRSSLDLKIRTVISKSVRNLIPRSPPSVNI